jgi:hypothetical protein
VPPPTSPPHPITSEYPSADWLSALDVDEDGVIGAHDLINALFVVGAALTLTEFDKLLSEVQVDASKFETVVFGKFSPEKLSVAIETFEEEQLRGTLGMVKHNLVKFFSYALAVPMLNVTWPIRTIKTDTISSKATANALIWIAGLSFTVGIWGLWVPSLIICILYPDSETILWADLMNPAILYWVFVAFLFNVWGGHFYAREGVRQRVEARRALFSLSFLRLHDPGEKVKIDNARDYCKQLLQLTTPLTAPAHFSLPITVLSVVRHLRYVEFSTELTSEGLGDRFVQWRLENRRRSSFAVGVEQARRDHVKEINPYSKSTVKLWVTLALPAITPLITRAVEGRAVLGNARDIACNVMLTLLTTWLWFALYSVIFSKITKTTHQTKAAVDLVLDLTVHHRLRQLDSYEGKFLPSEAKKAFHHRELSELDLSETKNIATFFEMYVPTSTLNHLL